MLPHIQRGSVKPSVYFWNLPLLNILLHTNWAQSTFVQGRFNSAPPDHHASGSHSTSLLNSKYVYSQIRIKLSTHTDSKTSFYFNYKALFRTDSKHCIVLTVYYLIIFLGSIWNSKHFYVKYLIHSFLYISWYMVSDVFL